MIQTFMLTIVGCVECKFECHIQKTFHQQNHIQRLSVRKDGSYEKEWGLDMQLASS